MAAPALELKRSYFDELCAAMSLLAAYKEVVFMGQGVGVAGTTMSQTLEHLPPHKRLEMPVAEDMQMGMAIGMALDGLLPVCIFPRWNFLLLAANQLINHLDRMPLYSGYHPKVIIRTAIPSKYPFNPGPQHDDDFTDAFRAMARTIDFVRLDGATSVIAAYEKAILSKRCTLLVEYTDLYRNARGNAAPTK